MQIISNRRFQDDLHDKWHFKKLRFQFDALVKLHNKITPKDVVKERKEFRKALFVRNNYTEMLNILQADIMNKLTMATDNPIKQIH